MVFFPNKLVLVVSAALIAGATGCASSRTPEGEASALLRESESRIQALESEVAQREARIDSLSSELSRKTTPAVSSAPPSSSYNKIPGGELLPPAKPGECYARVFIPPTYETRTEDMLSRSASEKLEVIPAKYESATEQVLVKAASTRIEVIPAVYGWDEEQVLVTPASSRLESIPATYETREEKVLVKAAHTEWKKGTGPIEKVDSATGEIMCLVDVPAEYKVVRTRVQTAPPSTREVAIPAVYKTVKKQVMTKAPTTRTIEIPAVYKTMKVRKVVAPATERRTPIAAEYQTVTKRVQTSEGQMAWREILCKTNTSGDIVRRLQAALDAAGHDPGPIDGVIGRQTTTALKSYQAKKGLATGGLTLNTLKSLGVL